MRALVPIIVLGVAASVGQAAQPGGLIGGVVRNAWTRQPLRRVAVTLTTTGERPLEALTYTDSNGAFAFSGVPQGAYYLSATLTGYERAVYGARSKNSPALPVRLAAGASRTDIVVPMYPLGSISGSVRDEAGEPVPGAEVQLLGPRHRRGQLAWLPFNRTITDEQGRYQIPLVQPGSYRVVANKQGEPALRIRPEVTNGSPEAQEMYGRQYYPGVDSSKAAGDLVISAGNEIKDIDFNLPIIRPFRVSGTVNLPAGDVTPERSIRVTLQPLDGEIPFRRGFGGMGGVGPDHRFAIPSVLPGNYRLVAMSFGDETSYRGTKEISVNADMDDVVIDIAAGSPLKGHLKIEGGTAKASDLEVNLSPGEAGPFGRPPSVEIAEDGSFEFDSVVSGIWDIGVNPLPDGFYIKSMRYGDQDVLDEEMNLEIGNRPALEIVVSARAATVEGSVLVEAGGAKRTRGLVLLAPAEPKDRVLSYYERVSADADGHFRIKNVTPGRYRLFAFDELAPDEHQDANLLKPWLEQTEVFEIGESAVVKRDVAIITRGESR